MSLKLPLATVMKVKSTVIWREINKCIQRYYALELKAFNTFLRKAPCFYLKEL